MKKRKRLKIQRKGLAILTGIITQLDMVLYADISKWQKWIDTKYDTEHVCLHKLSDTNVGSLP